jgi:predicted secreted protein
LGHAVLEHKPSLDSGDVLRRAASDIEGASPAGFASRLQEIEADAFAGEFLLPSWLIVHHAKTQSWSAADLGTPNIAYQLSLRCGTSYGATVRALLRNQIINGNQSAAALDVKPKLIKRTIRRRDEWSSPWSDTWLLSERDITQDGLPITAGDLVGVQLPQNAGSGFLQRPQLPYPSELTPIADWTDVDETTVGQPGLKTFVLRAEAQGPVKFAFSHGRPWDPGQQVSEFRLAIKEREEGLSRANRIHLGMEAVSMEFDLSSQLGPTRDQGSRPTCLSFALSDCHRIKRASNDDLSPECIHSISSKEMGHSGDRAISLSSALHTLKGSGQTYEHEWPYGGVN